MKNSFKAIICSFAITMFAILSANAEDKETKKVSRFGTGIYATNQGKININIDKYQNSETVVLLLDQRGTALYREVIGNDQMKLRRALDVSQLQTGSYRIQVTSKGETTTKHFDITENVSPKLVSVR